MRRAIWALGLCSLAGAAAGQAVSPSAPMTFAEVMARKQTLDDARYSPDGRRLLFTVRRNNVPTGGLMVSVTSREAWVADLVTGTRTRIGATDGGYLAPPCDPWSPSGREVALITERDSVGRVAVFRPDTRTLEVFAPLPTTTCVRWVGTKLVYAAASPQAPAVWSLRDRAARQLARWSSVWSGGPAEVSVHSNNPAFPAPPAPEAGLAIADPATGEARLAIRGDFVGVTPSPDGKTFAAIRLGAADPGALSASRGRRGELQVYRLEGAGAALVQSLPAYDVGEGGLAWSPDGARLLVGARLPATNQVGLFLLLPDSAPQPVPLPADLSLRSVQPGAVVSFLGLGWIGGCPAFLAATPGVAQGASDQRTDYGEGRGLVFRLFVAAADGVRALTDFTGQSVTRFGSTPRGRGLVVADGALWEVGPRRAPRRVTAPGLKVTGLSEWEPFGGGPFKAAVNDQAVAVNVQGDDGAPQRMTVSLATGAVVLSTPARDFMAWSPDLGVAAVARSDGWASALWSLGVHGGRIAAFNPDWTARPVGAIRQITYRAGGKTLPGWVVLPPGWHGAPAPAIVWIYGGQVLAGVPLEARPGGGASPVYEGQLWAARGYAVIYPSTPLVRGPDSDLAASLAEAATAAIDAAAAQGWVDPARVGIIGHSFGGYSTAAVLSRRSDRFKAGVAMSGIYDYAAAWAARAPSESMVDANGHGFTLETRSYVERGQAGLGAPPWSAAAAYARASPFYDVARIRTPLLLTVGDFDLGVTELQQSERFYAALQRTGNPAVLVRYWGEVHTQAEPATVVDQWSRFTAWFDHYLKAPDPVDELTAPAGAAPPGSPGPGSANAGPRLPPTPPTGAPSAGRPR